jgi:RING finger protein 113A
MHGWQMDNMYLSNQRPAKEATPEPTEEEQLPFACLICRKPFTDPIVTSTFMPFMRFVWCE